MGPRATITGVRGAGSSARATPARERAALVGLAFGSRRREQVDDSLDELAGLAVTAGATVVIRMVQERPRPDPAFFLGRGKVETLARACDEQDIGLVIIDDELSPGQLRSLEAVVGRRVIDRTQLILDIFASRARSREGQLQVELAQLRYLLPRLTGLGSTLSRLGGGIGTRGPGETKLETDRRRIRQRLSRLGRELEAVRRRRSRSQGRRRKGAVPTVALVGYTNAGKTSLFNLLAGTDVPSSSALFATLDPLVRAMRLPDQRTVLVSDTVGFIDRLPHTLVAAFRATLEEVAGADLLVHVVDASDEGYDERCDAVHRVLDDVGAADRPRLLVLNKIDRLTDGGRERLRQRHPDAVLVSAATGEGREALVDAVTAALSLNVRRVTLELDETVASDQDRLTEVYRRGRVLRHERTGRRVSLEVEVPARLLAQWTGKDERVREADTR